MKLHTKALILLVAIFSIVVMSSTVTLQYNFDIQKDSILRGTQAEIHAVLKYYFEQQKGDLSTLLSNHAYWTDLKDNLAKNDSDWIKDNVTQYLIFDPQTSLDVLLLQSDEYDYEDFYGIIDRKHILDSKVVKAVKSGQLMSSGYVLIDNAIYLLVAAPITNNDYTDPDGVFVIGRQIDNSVIQNLSKILNSRDITEIGITISTRAMKPDVNIRNAETFEVHFPLIDDLGDGKYVYLSVHLLSNWINDITLATLKQVMLSFVIVFTIGIMVIYMLFFRISRNIDIGMAQIDRIADGNYDEVMDLDFSIEFKRLSSSVNKLSSEVQDKIERLNRYYIEMISVMVKSIEVTDRYTRGHSERVSHYAVAIAKALHYNDIETIRISGLMHDIGKIAIDGSILNKGSKLTFEEYQKVREHPTLGFKILDSANVFDQCKDIILHHHEYYDGSGYPDGLSNDEIPLGSRIIAVADSFDAMTSDRSYRPAIPVFRALEIIQTSSGTQFDPEVVETFLRIAEQTFNEWSLLSESPTIAEFSVNRS